MKRKIVSVLLTLVIFITFGVVGVKAQADIEALENEFFQFCDNNIKSYEGDSVKIYDYVEADSMIFFNGQCSWIFMHQNVAKVESLGDCYFISGVRENGMSGLDVYVKADGTIYPLETGYENNVVTDLIPVSKLQGQMFCRIGDVNDDDVLNIRDATELQKFIANKEADTITNTSLQKKVFDMNKDEAVNVKDATAIQKRIAKIS